MCLGLNHIIWFMLFFFLVLNFRKSELNQDILTISVVFEGRKILGTEEKLYLVNA